MGRFGEEPYGQDGFGGYEVDEDAGFGMDGFGDEPFGG